MMGGSQGKSSEGADVGGLIAENDMVVFATPTCPFCRRAISELQKAGFEPNIVHVDGVQRSALTEITGKTSVPQVFVKGQFIGGCNDGGLGGTLPLLFNGKIAEMMAAEPACEGEAS